MTTELIPFRIETRRIVELLAKQIYQSPLALLRENAQNAFDAIKIRLHLGQHFEPRIDIDLTPDKIVVRDNGIGMSRDDLNKHFWCAGSSSKNNAEARAAGVVGTFGIGAMANFGIADELNVETEHALTGERTRSSAQLQNLSVTQDCIEISDMGTTGRPGTRVEAKLRPGTNLDVSHATNYIAEFVTLVDTPVFVNNICVSLNRIENLVPRISSSQQIDKLQHAISPQLTADIEMLVSNNAEVWMQLQNISWAGQPLIGKMVVRSGQSAFRTFRSGFGLAVASASSFFQFGGICDFRVFEPTAGREAITSEGVQLLQSIVHELDAFVSIAISVMPECDSSSHFMSWVAAHGRYELCDLLKINIAPGERTPLGDIKSRSVVSQFPVYDGQDQSIIKQFSSEDTPLILVARSNPRRQIELNYLAAYCKTQSVSDAPQIVEKKKRSEYSNAEMGLAFRIETILEHDYFLGSNVSFGRLSHGLPILISKEDSNVLITIDPSASSVATLIGLYDSEFSAFRSMVKDYVRSVVFPRVADYVPSATRQGAESFLNAIKRTREYVEYDDSETDSNFMAKILEDYKDGRIEFSAAIEQWKSAAQGAIQVVDENVTRDARLVVPDILENEAVLSREKNVLTEHYSDHAAAPSILRQEISSSAKLLVISDQEPPLRGYKTFIAITDSTKREFGEFFLQPHRTAVVWGGQRTLFVFLHHSGQFGLYYDLLSIDQVEPAAGGGQFITSTIVLKDKIFIPIPSTIRSNFIPKAGEKKRFEVRGDIIKTGDT
jgi:molecular chaperone HtpG